MDDVYEEYVIVDEKDRVIGKAPRKFFHERGKHIHQGVIVFVVNDKGEIAIQKRSRKKDLYKGYYNSSVAGHVRYGETYYEAAKRELSEELPNVLGNSVEVARFRVYSNIERENIAFFICRFNGEIKFDEEEIDSIEYMSLEEIEKKMKTERKKFPPGFIRALEEYEKCVVK